MIARYWRIIGVASAGMAAERALVVMVVSGTESV